MARVKRGTTVRAKHNKILKMAKGYRGRNSKVFTVAKRTNTEWVYDGINDIWAVHKVKK